MTADADGVPAGLHPDVETLADLEEGLLPAERAATLRRHVAGCPRCADGVAALRLVADELTALRREPVPPLPRDVADRLGAALAAAGAPVPASSTAAPSDGSPGPAGGTTAPTLAGRRRRLPIWLGSAAASVVLLAVGTLAVDLFATGPTGEDVATRGNDSAVTTDAEPGSAAESATTSAPVTASGTDYSAATLAAAVPGLLAGTTGAPLTPKPLSSVLPPDAAREPDGDSAPEPAAESAAPGLQIPRSSASGQDQPSPGDQNEVDWLAALTPLQNPARLAACVRELTGTGIQPLAVDFARFTGSAAAVVALPGRPEEVDVYVVGPRCDTGDADLRYFTRVGLPS